MGASCDAVLSATDLRRMLEDAGGAKASRCLRCRFEREWRGLEDAKDKKSASFEVVIIQLGLFICPFEAIRFFGVRHDVGFTPEALDFQPR